MKYVAIVSGENVAQILDSKEFDFCILMQDPDGELVSGMLASRFKKPDKPTKPQVERDLEEKKSGGSKHKSKAAESNEKFMAMCRDMAQGLSTKEEACRILRLRWSSIEQVASRLRKIHGEEKVPYFGKNMKQAES